MREVRGDSTGRKGLVTAILVALVVGVPAFAGGTFQGGLFSSGIAGYSHYLDLNEVLGTEIGNARKAFLNPTGNYRFEVLGNAAVRMGGAISEIRPQVTGAVAGISEAARIVIQVVHRAAVDGTKLLDNQWRSASWGLMRGFQRELYSSDPSVRVVEYVFPQNDELLVINVEGRSEQFDQVVRSLTDIERL